MLLDRKRRKFILGGTLMKIGIIGAGPIGTTIAKKLVNKGHDVKIADTRGLDNMAGCDYLKSGWNGEL